MSFNDLVGAGWIETIKDDSIVYLHPVSVRFFHLHELDKATVAQEIHEDILSLQHFKWAVTQDNGYPTDKIQCASCRFLHIPKAPMGNSQGLLFTFDEAMALQAMWDSPPTEKQAEELAKKWIDNSKKWGINLALTLGYEIHAAYFKEIMDQAKEREQIGIDKKTLTFSTDLKREADKQSTRGVMCFVILRHEDIDCLAKMTSYLIEKHDYMPYGSPQFFQFKKTLLTSIALLKKPNA